MRSLVVSRAHRGAALAGAPRRRRRAQRSSFRLAERVRPWVARSFLLGNSLLIIGDIGAWSKRIAEKNQVRGFKFCFFSAGRRWGGVRTGEDAAAGGATGGAGAAVGAAVFGCRRRSRRACVERACARADTRLELPWQGTALWGVCKPLVWLAVGRAVQFVFCARSAIRVC